MAAGAVTTGFSYPQVADYAFSGGQVSYSNVKDLARGVSFNPQITAANSNNIFYANNKEAERGQPRFASGTVGLTVDGVFVAAEKQIMGVPGTSTDTVTVGETSHTLVNYDDGQSIPYEGMAVVLQQQSNGQTFYRAFIYRKVQFAQFDVPANTEGENIEWQTTALSAAIYRDDTAKHAWKSLSEPVESELEAYNIGRVFLGGTAVQALPV
jgi:hypothetical protein